MFFLEYSLLYIDGKFQFIPELLNWWLVSIVSVNGLMPTWLQAITWTNVDQDALCCFCSKNESTLWVLFFRGNKSIYLHFVSFINIDMTQAVEILSQVRQELTYSSQYHQCWCPGNVRSQGISNHDIDLLKPRYSGIPLERPGMSH